eukprot:5458046-Amphidinium_carterae.1
MASLAMCTYLIFFGLGLSPVPWLVNAEIFPLQTRGAAIGLTTAANWIANFFVAATFLNVSRTLSTDQDDKGPRTCGVTECCERVRSCSKLLLRPFPNSKPRPSPLPVRISHSCFGGSGGHCTTIRLSRLTP